MPVFILVENEEGTTLTFLPADAPLALLEPGDREIWRVEASSWEIANLKKHEFLGFEPYKPLIVNDLELWDFLPQNPDDADNLQLLLNLGLPSIAPILPDLISRFLTQNGAVRPILIHFLRKEGPKALRTLAEAILAQNPPPNEVLFRDVLVHWPHSDQESLRILIQSRLGPNPGPEWGEVVRRLRDWEG